MQPCWDFTTWNVHSAVSKEHNWPRAGSCSTVFEMFVMLLCVASVQHILYVYSELYKLPTVRSKRTRESKQISSLPVMTGSIPVQVSQPSHQWPIKFNASYGEHLGFTNSKSIWKPTSQCWVTEWCRNALLDNPPADMLQNEKDPDPPKPWNLRYTGKNNWNQCQTAISGASKWCLFAETCP